MVIQDKKIPFSMDVVQEVKMIKKIKRKLKHFLFSCRNYIQEFHIILVHMRFKSQSKGQQEYQCGNISKFPMFIPSKQVSVERIKLTTLFQITKVLEEVFVKLFA